ncbi:MAG TPA: S1/P1 nuclease [Steroidobacteraceae bacterium]|nr:S1/P1 nuclease [Steroidobacteraceae bacterium]
MSRSFFFSVASLLLLANAPSWAWGELGHRLVGELAQRQLTPEANARVHELLRTEPVPTLAGVAMWADQLRASDPERFKATAAWHYVNIHDTSCRFVGSRDCPDGACVLGAIDAQSRLLGDPAQPVEVRRDALKFIVHFVGDVHQPVHSSNRPDKGGNEFQISLRTDIPPEEYARERYKNGIMSTNLHAVWDYYVLASAKLTLGDYADRLAAASRSATPQSSPAEWARDSCELIDRRALYPHSHKMNAKYLNAMRPLAEQRVGQAADRLARLLNEMFASH